MSFFSTKVDVKQIKFYNFPTKFMTNTKNIIPVVIMRHGGLDGVAMQKNEYRTLMKMRGYEAHIITGLKETQFGDPGTDCPIQTIVKRLDFNHPDSLKLFANQFVHGPETEMAPKITDKEWIALFEKHKKIIKEEIFAAIEKLNNKRAILVFNLLALRHAQPAAAVALREIIKENPKRMFVSHAADPDAERPEKISRIKPFVLERISALPPDQPYSGAPYNFENLFHIVLNPKQWSNFVERYGIPINHVYEVCDFLEFKSAEPELDGYPEKEFMALLERNSLYAEGKSYSYYSHPVGEDTVYFLSPVRPVYRKRLKEAMLVAHYYKKSRGRDVAFVVTHPDIDDKRYFLETIWFANGLGLNYIHLGHDFSLDKLNEAYDNMATLQTIGVVASRAGGWENALNEMARDCIPFFMSTSLNSYIPITERIGIKTHGIDFGAVEKLINESLISDLRIMDLSSVNEMEEACRWIDDALDDNKRWELIEHNYKQAYKHLSLEATAKRLEKLVAEIEDRRKTEESRASQREQL